MGGCGAVALGLILDLEFRSKAPRQVIRDASESRHEAAAGVLPSAPLGRSRAGNSGLFGPEKILKPPNSDEARVAGRLVRSRSAASFFVFFAFKVFGEAEDLPRRADQWERGVRAMDFRRSPIFLLLRRSPCLNENNPLPPAFKTVCTMRVCVHALGVVVVSVKPAVAMHYHDPPPRRAGLGRPGLGSPMSSFP
ncbi:hypothetical protein BDY21DRAFT_33450 [Lineolata rhizophorae]|uniref:Uncharacterized protein n=1 Tax=Lineolata rhizophorae TaxID=578093 RepID=A0A6A6NZE3_9PEZI|nr:hypothetical protein BDY21DRAFT_33450 [Lineolata rhizophorae]